VPPFAFPLLLAILLPWAAFAREGKKEWSKDIVGLTNVETILVRPEFSKGYENSRLEPDLGRRWGAIDSPCTVVVVFGSWCGDSHRWLPEAIRLAEESNPFVSVHWIGIGRNKKTKKADWPEGSVRQRTRRVPTFWLFAPTPGGGARLAGSIVENPPKAHQGMAEALVELLEKALN
jgi:hypothetical protein